MRRPGRSCLAAFVLLAAGCREELGPTRSRTARVVGSVRVGARPVGGGWIEFLPGPGTVGNVRSAPIRPDGSFEADRVPIGAVMIGVAGAPIDRALSGLFHPLSSPIRRTIPDAPTATIPIDLREEAARARTGYREVPRKSK